MNEEEVVLTKKEDQKDQNKAKKKQIIKHNRHKIVIYRVEKIGKRLQAATEGCLLVIAMIFSTRYTAFYHRNGYYHR